LAAVDLELTGNIETEQKRTVGPNAFYSQRSAVIGSTCVARHAGSELATSPIAISKAAVRANVNGSVDRTPYSRLSSNLVTPLPHSIIPAGQYTASKDNKAYAVRAAALLSEGTRKWSIGELWRAVSDDPEKAHNSQMDVVLALWKNGLMISKQ
jgi:hypothetical protein